ncbi:MAG: CBS domain-containing protein [Gemmatimonadales bacterium]
MDAHEEVARAFLANHPEEAARELERADPTEAASLLAALAPAVAAEVWRAMGPSYAAACAAVLGDDALAAIVDWLPPDRGGDVLRRLDEAKRRSILELLDEETRGRLGGKLSYEEHSAGALADPLVPALPEDVTVAEALLQLRRSRSHVLHYLYVVSRDRELVGALTLPDLMIAQPSDTLGSVMHRGLVRLDAHTDLAAVAAHPAWSDHDALPVVDGAGRLVGAIRHRSIRRLGAPAPRALVATLVGLSEVYWAGLSGILASFAPVRPVTVEGADVE